MSPGTSTTIPEELAKEFSDIARIPDRLDDLDDLDDLDGGPGHVRSLSGVSGPLPVLPDFPVRFLAPQINTAQNFYIISHTSRLLTWRRIS